MEANLAPAVLDTDLDLTERVSDALNALDVLRGSRARVEVLVTNAHVTLEGILQSPMAAVEVERAAAEVPGVAGVTNHLIDDGTLSRRVAEAMAKDPRTAAVGPGYEVTSVFGRVVLIGYFTPEQSRVLVVVCQSVPGVRAVVVKAL